MGDPEKRFSYDQLRKWGNLVLQKSGMDQEEIDYALDALLSSNLRGVDTHGINLVRFYAERHKSIPHRDIKVVMDAPATCLIDGGDHSGPITSVKAMDICIKKADAYGIGMAIVGHASHFGACGYYAKYATEKGYIGFCTTTGISMMAPWNGLKALVGNNPVAISFPFREFPIVHDIAQSVVARQRIHTYNREKKKLPDGWALDSSGNPTNDPQEALDGFLMPIGGHKGVGIALMIELIASVLNHGHGFSTGGCPNAVVDRPMNVSHMFLVIKPDFYLPKAELDRIVDEYVAVYRSVPAKPGVEKVLLPGELEWMKEQDRRKNGIPISDALIKEMNDYADKAGLPPLG
jgi:LDH2 family malate/lactate/ureidoglycolate dehydrogenase